MMAAEVKEVSPQKDRERKIRYLTAYAKYLEAEVERLRRGLALKMQRREKILNELSRLRSEK